MAVVNSNLDMIRNKVRRLTRSPSESQVTTDQIDEYINTFVLYDFPEHLRLFSLRTTHTFYTEPYVEEYDSDNPAPELDDFKNEYISVHEPVYIAGRRVPLYQDRDRFYGVYPKVQSIRQIATGDGATTVFTGTLPNVPILKNHVLFSSIENTLTLELHDQVGGTGTSGLLTGKGTGNINYVTGAYTLNFTSPPDSGEAINSQTVPYVPSLPQALLFFDNKFYVRPIPDQAYSVEFEVYKRPTELLLTNQSPELEQWWQYVAYGAAKKLFEDRTDEEGVRMIMPEFKKQERLVLRKTIVQQTNERVYTIYTDNFGDYSGSYWWTQR